MDDELEDATSSQVTIGKAQALRGEVIVCQV
jgi:hypothetical protein